MKTLALTWLLGLALTAPALAAEDPDEQYPPCAQLQARGDLWQTICWSGDAVSLFAVSQDEPVLTNGVWIVNQVTTDAVTCTLVPARRLFVALPGCRLEAPYAPAPAH
jgi:hypothetical protein